MGVAMDANATCGTSDESEKIEFGMWESLLMGVSANAGKPGNVSTVFECTLM